MHSTEPHRAVAKGSETPPLSIASNDSAFSTRTNSLRAVRVWTSCVGSAGGGGGGGGNKKRRVAEYVRDAARQKRTPSRTYGYANEAALPRRLFLRAKSFALILSRASSASRPILLLGSSGSWHRGLVAETPLVDERALASSSPTTGSRRHSRTIFSWSSAACLCSWKSCDTPCQSTTVTAYRAGAQAARLICHRISFREVRSSPNMSASKCSASLCTLSRPTCGGRKTASSPSGAEGATFDFFVSPGLPRAALGSSATFSLSSSPNRPLTIACASASTFSSSLGFAGSGFPA